MRFGQKVYIASSCSWKCDICDQLPTDIRKIEQKLFTAAAPSLARWSSIRYFFVISNLKKSWHVNSAWPKKIRVHSVYVHSNIVETNLGSLIYPLIDGSFSIFRAVITLLLLANRCYCDSSSLKNVTIEII